MLLKDSITNFQKYLGATDKSVKTIISYSSNLTSFGNFLEDKYNCAIYLDEITTKDIEDYLCYLKCKNLKNTSRSQSLYCIRSFFNWAYKNKLCTWNIALEIEPIKLKHEERIYLTVEEFKELSQSIDHPLIRVIIETLFYTGLRISECLNLKLDNVDLNKKLIYVIAGKGNKDRNIPINENLKKTLLTYLNNERKDMESNYFFATSKSGKISGAYVNRVLNDAVHNLGWKKHVTAHILRHSFASNLIKNGVSLVYVQKLLGHSNLKITSIYTHADMDELNKSVNLL